LITALGISFMGPLFPTLCEHALFQRFYYWVGSA